MAVPNIVLNKCAALCEKVYTIDEDWMYDDSIAGYRILAIEGTYEKTDWFTNLKFLFKANDMHRGFKGNGERTLTEIMCAGFDLPKERRLVLTGHSLGGASATCLADKLRERYDDLILVTFGSPRPGGRVLRDRMSQVEHYRYVHGDDIVPKTPPFLAGYVHTCDEVHLEDESERIADGVQDHNMGSYRRQLFKHLLKK